MKMVVLLDDGLTDRNVCLDVCDRTLGSDAEVEAGP